MIIGVDEVNFSPSIAGDCVVCAYAAHKKVRGVKDSKQLDPERRLKLFERLQEAGSYSIAIATVNEINNHGTYFSRNNAIITATRSLVYWLTRMAFIADVEKIIIDGYFSEKWLSIFKSEFRGDIPIECLVDGDQKVYEISSASIVAKVYVDALFQGYASFYPGYRLEINHGSPDKKMYEKIRRSGPTPFHRINYGSGWWKKIYAEDRS